MNRPTVRPSVQSTVPPVDDERWLADYVALFNHPTPAPEALQRLLADDYCFEDPFHRIEGRDALANYLRQSHAALGGMHFQCLGHAFDGEIWLLRWRFQARLCGEPWVFEGASALRLDHQGRVVQHRDFWDSALFYGRLPLIGHLIRWVRRRLQRALRG